jgi:hypothetical protein
MDVGFIVPNSIKRGFLEAPKYEKTRTTGYTTPHKDAHSCQHVKGVRYER